MHATAGTELRILVDAFASEAVEHFHEFKEFKALYYESPRRIDLLNASAKRFFSDLFYQYLDRIVLNVSRLTDPSRQGSNRNLSVYAIHERCGEKSEYPKDRAETIVEEMTAVAKSVAKWRSKRVAHIDLSVALGTKALADKVNPSEIQAYYETLDKYVSLVYEAIFGEPFSTDAVSHYGADDLVRTLGEGMALRDLLDREPRLYDQILRGSRWHDV